MKPLRICVFCLLALFADGVAVFATSIPITGGFTIGTNSYGSGILGPSLSIGGDTLLGTPEVSLCLPGDTCTFDVGVAMSTVATFSPFGGGDDVVGTLDGVTGFMMGGVEFQATVTVPVFDPATWEDGYFINFDAGLEPFSGSATAYSCDPLGTSPPCAPLNYEEFSVDLSGTADATYFAQGNGLIVDASYNVVNGTATVTYLNDPTPESSEAVLMSFGLMAIFILKKLKWGSRYFPG